MCISGSKSAPAKVLWQNIPRIREMDWAKKTIWGSTSDDDDQDFFAMAIDGESVKEGVKF